MAHLRSTLTGAEVSVPDGSVALMGPEWEPADAKSAPKRAPKRDAEKASAGDEK